jgi:hypothetical protein
MWGMQELRKHLREKLDIGDRQLNRLIAAKADELPSTREEALHVLAFENRLTLQNYLTPEQIAAVRGLVGNRPAPAPTPAKPSRREPKSQDASLKQIQVGDYTVPTAALNARHVNEAIAMAKVYPLLYVFENSVREFLDGHLRAEYGDDWHLDPRIVNTTMRGRVERNRAAEDATRYHSRRNERFIYYTDITDLPLIAGSENGWKVFGRDSLLPSTNWLTSIVERIAPSRNVVAHMNPIVARDIRRVGDLLEDWLDQIRTKRP